MKKFLGLGGSRNNQSRQYRDDDRFDETFYEDEEFELTDEYPEDEFEATDEYPEDEFSEEEYASDEYSEEYDEGMYQEEEYVPEEYSEYACEDDSYPTDDEAAFTGEILYVEPDMEADAYLTEDFDREDSDGGYDYVEEDDDDGAAGFSAADIVDKIVAFGSVAVLLIGIVILGFFFMSRQPKEEKQFLNVGNQLAQIEVIGGSGLLAVADAQQAVIDAAIEAENQQKEEESKPEYEEQEYKTEVNVKLSVSSIEKDLKIKFINQDTGKLVGNVPFSVKIKDPSGGENLWSDDDMDGIIYKKNLAAGQYKISVNELVGDKYKKYGLPTGEKKAEVKAKIVYEKVDIANEVKSESQVDVKKEDTKKNETVVESTLTDTVSWVESTATLVSYTEVAKTNIPDPLKLAWTAGFSRISGTDAQVSGGEVNPTPSPSPSASPSPSPSASPSPSPSVSPSPSPSVSPSPTPTPSPMAITLDKKTATVFVDHPAEIAVSVTNMMKDAVITAESSDTNVATVSVKDQKITVIGLAAGTANITVNCSAEVKTTIKDKDGKETTKTETFKAPSVVCSVVVKVNPKKDTATILKDNEGREIYVLEGTEYRAAHHADYYTYSKFFVKGAPKYTGWQTLNGKRMYYDASGKFVTGEQVIQGVKYTFASDGALVTGSGTLGIDVSKWNGNIDWTAVKNSGVSYVIIRCGYRGSSQGALIEDSKFKTNIQGAINAGLKVGVYFFSQAIDKNEALEEASMVLECIKNYKISYPVFLDVEPSGGRADNLDVATRTEVCKTFCETIQKYGYTAGIYANKNWFTEKINTGELSGSYKIWLAQYAAEPTYAGRYDMWQYKSTGKISGINGDVDMNLSYLGY